MNYSRLIFIKWNIYMDILSSLAKEINLILTTNNPTIKKFEKDAINFFSNELISIKSDNDIESTIKNTRAYVLFEGFYNSIENAAFKSQLLSIRASLWTKHFSTPTVPFLLSYKKEIEDTKKLFSIFANSQSDLVNTPWMVSIHKNFLLDEINNIFVDPVSISKVVTPAEKEKTGEFTKTHNPSGGFTTTPCDPVSIKFIEHASLAAKNHGKVLEIGAAFGAATLEAIEQGATVFCNDIEAENLAVVKKRYMELNGKNISSNTGDDNNLVLIPGEFPNELSGLPKNSFDAILICRVLHFFSGAKIEESLEFLTSLLAPQGKIYVVCETPFLKNWQKFIPEFNSRVQAGEEWPGEINNPADFESSGRASSLPKFVHWMTKEVLKRSIERAGLSVETVEYIDRKGQFPDDLLLQDGGRESVGAIGVYQG